MLALLILAISGVSDVDHHCREKFGHPGDIGATYEAERYFTNNMSYVEASATIGELGTEVPSDVKSKVDQWQNGRLEMHFRNDRLTKYRMDENWTVYLIPVDEFMPRLTASAQALNASQIQQLASDEDRKSEFENFYRGVIQIIEVGKQATQTNLERTDLKALEHHASKLARAIATKKTGKRPNGFAMLCKSCCREVTL